jgi:hypothetical protein
MNEMISGYSSADFSNMRKTLPYSRRNSRKMFTFKPNIRYEKREFSPVPYFGRIVVGLPGSSGLEGGLDSIENVVALCPNCHRRMQVLNLPADEVRLKNGVSVGTEYTSPFSLERQYLMRSGLLHVPTRYHFVPGLHIRYECIHTRRQAMKNTPIPEQLLPLVQEIRELVLRARSTAVSECQYPAGDHQLRDWPADRGI